jgi:hypothetical protein
MRAVMMGKEKLTITAKNAVIEACIMVVIIAMEGDFEPGEPKAFSLFSVALGFLDLANHPVVHLSISPFWVGNKKRHAKRSMPCSS